MEEPIWLRRETSRSVRPRLALVRGGVGNAQAPISALCRRVGGILFAFLMLGDTRRLARFPTAELHQPGLDIVLWAQRKGQPVRAGQVRGYL